MHGDVPSTDAAFPCLNVYGYAVCVCIRSGVYAYGGCVCAYGLE